MKNVLAFLIIFISMVGYALFLNVEVTYRHLEIFFGVVSVFIVALLADLII